MEYEILKYQNLHWKNFLLIKPNYRTIGWDYYNMDFPPINLTYIASYLIDVDVEILDTKVRNLSTYQIKKKIEKFNPDIVGISVFVSAALKTSLNITKI